MSRQQLEGRLDRVIGELAEFVPRAVLDRMRNVEHRRLETERLRLGLHRLGETGGDDRDAGNAALVEIA